MVARARSREPSKGYRAHAPTEMPEGHQVQGLPMRIYPAKRVAMTFRAINQ